ncbi:hypothetical protein SADUNF_Sadunf06G0125900 [Salix dunnii]|uniref:Uncharacterized protein n=1 Tax=Salix dunnii TaxID=1413687 RepID=A0A835N307_9ROSI|nr:hypothetical protein SADUNF_Sadunf06G0125900 [Salix dunnii]
MKRAIQEAFRSTMSDQITKAKEFLRSIKNEKAEINMLLTCFISMKYKSKENEEERLKQDKMESFHLTFTFKDKGGKRKNNNEVASVDTSSVEEVRLGLDKGVDSGSGKGTGEQGSKSIMYGVDHD